MTVRPLQTLVDAAASAAALDAPAKRLAKSVRDAAKPGPVRDAIGGTWLGHALHPVLTDVVIGTWTSASILDLVGGEDAAVAAERLIGVGIAAYGPTAVTGMTDWADTEPVSDGIRRVGVVHAAANSAALALYVGSLASRRRGRRGLGIGLALAGAGVLTAGGYLGGHLAYADGVGVDQTAFDRGPDEWTRVLAADEVREGEPAVGVAGDTPVLVLRQGALLSAVHDRCSHRGCSLASGEFEDGIVTCPCHGSRFRLRDGALLRGPATTGQPAFEVREREGDVEVRRAQRS